MANWALSAIDAVLYKLLGTDSVSILNGEHSFDEIFDILRHPD